MADRLRVLVVVSLVAAASCSSPSSPSTPTLTGSWSGTELDAFESATLQATITQSGSSLTGTWSVTNTYGDSSSGTLSGVVDGSNVTMKLQSTSVSPTCLGDPQFTKFVWLYLTATATFNSAASQISGTFDLFACPEFHFDNAHTTFGLTKQ
jgi:hypothetical protein